MKVSHRNSKHTTTVKPLQIPKPATTVTSMDEQPFQQTLRNGTLGFDQLNSSQKTYNSSDDGFYNDTGLRWNNVCDDPLDELRRIETYKANRRLRYINANSAKIASLTIKERKF